MSSKNENINSSNNITSDNNNNDSPSDNNNTNSNSNNSSSIVSNNNNDSNTIISNNNSDSSNNTSSNNNNNNNNNDNNQSVWDTQSKCILLESIGKFLPLGVNKHFSILNCTIILHEKMPQKNFSYDQVHKEISEYYNLDELDDDVIDEDEREVFNLPSTYKALMDEKVKKK